MRSASRVWLTVGPLALAVGGGALAVVLTSNHEENQVLVSVFGLLVGWSFVVAGLIARTRRPENRTGILMIVVGLMFFAGALAASNVSVLFTIGLALGALFIGALIHLLLAYPSGRLASRRELALVVSSYVVAFLANALPLLFDGTPGADDCAECPDNAMLVKDNPTADDALAVVFQGLGFLLIALVVVMLVRRWRGSSPAARRLLGPVLIAGGITLGFFALTMILVPLSEEAAGVISVGFVAGFVATPFVFLWGILRSRLARADVGALLADSRETPSLVETQEAVRNALRDPTAELVYALDDPTGYFSVDRRRVRLDEVGSDRAVMEIESADGPLAAVIHDPALLNEPELLSSVAMGLRLRLEKDRSVRALRISEYRSRALLDAIPDTMFRVARDGTVLDIHSHDPENVVIPPDEMIGTSLYDIPPEVISRETTEERKLLVERAFETGEAQTQEYEVHAHFGRRFAETRIVPSGENEFVMIVRDVTQERLTESRGRALLEAMPDAMFRLSRDGRFLDFHTPQPELLSIPADEIIGSSVYDIPPHRIAPEVLRERMELAERAFETGEVQTHRYEIRSPAGAIMYSEARIVPAGADEWVMIVRDVTEARLTESRSQALLEALPDSVFRLTRDGIYLDFRAVNAEHYLVEGESFIGTSIRDALPPDVAEGVLQAAERAFESGEMQAVEGRMEHEGKAVYAEARIVPSGENEFVMIVRDVTDRITQQRQIETQNEFLGAMGDATTGLLCNLHLDGRIGRDNVNLPLRELTGYEQYEVDGDYFWDVFVAPEDRVEAERVIREVVAGVDPGEQQSRWLTKDGREVIVAWTCRPMPHVTGEEPKLLISGTDVTERVRHGERIQRERDLLNAIANSTQTLLCLVDADANLSDLPLNRAMSELTGYSDEEVAQRSFTEIFVVPESRREVAAAIAEAAAGAPRTERETYWVTRDGRQVLVAWTCTPLPTVDGKSYFSIAGVDITERKLREEEQGALRRVAVAVASERRPEDVFQTVTEEAGRLLGADASNMVRYDPDASEGIVVGYWRRADAVQDDTVLGRRIALKGGPVSVVRNEARAMRFEPDDPPKPGYRERLRAEQTNSVVTAPVLVSGRVWGAVSVTLSEGSFPPETENRIAQFTNLVSTALANAEAREELLASLRLRKQREDEQAALRRVAVAVASEQRPESVFETVAEEVGRVLGANRAHMLRYDAQAEDAQIVGVWEDGEPEEGLIGRRVAVDRGPYRTIRELGRPMRFEVDGPIPPVLRQRLEAEGVTSVVVAPIVLSGDLWGAVSVSVTKGSLPPETEERIGPFTSLVATALANAEARQELLASRARIVEAGDAERRRLERNLHDGAQQRLVSLSLSLRLAQARLGSDPQAADEILSGASVELALALEELRELARGIHPAVLTDRGLGPALESLADRTPLSVELEELPDGRLPAQVEAAAFYVVSEALANVAKYAEATTVNVRVAQEDGNAIVEVADDGVGGADPTGGSGLRGLSDRVAALQGRLAIVSPPGAGTRIRAEIPVDEGG